MMRSIVIVCGQRRRPPPMRPSQAPRLLVCRRVTLQFECVMWPKRTLQKFLIRRQIDIDIFERGWRQSCTPDVERREGIIAAMVGDARPTCFEKVDAGITGSEGKTMRMTGSRFHFAFGTK